MSALSVARFQLGWFHLNHCSLWRHQSKQSKKVSGYTPHITSINMPVTYSKPEILGLLIVGFQLGFQSKDCSLRHHQNTQSKKVSGYTPHITLINIPGISQNNIITYLNEVVSALSVVRFHLGWNHLFHSHLPCQPNKQSKVVSGYTAHILQSVHQWFAQPIQALT